MVPAMAIGVAVGIRSPLVAIFLIPELLGDYALVFPVAAVVGVARLSTALSIASYWGSARSSRPTSTTRTRSPPNRSATSPRNVPGRVSGGGDRASPSQSAGATCPCRSMALEQLGNEGELRTLRRRLADNPLGGDDFVDHHHLDRRDGQRHWATLQGRGNPSPASATKSRIAMLGWRSRAQPARAFRHEGISDCPACDGHQPFPCCVSQTRSEEVPEAAEGRKRAELEKRLSPHTRRVGAISVSLCTVHSCVTKGDKA